MSASLGQCEDFFHFLSHASWVTKSKLFRTWSQNSPVHKVSKSAIDYIFGTTWQDSCSMATGVERGGGMRADTELKKN